MIAQLARHFLATSRAHHECIRALPLWEELFLGCFASFNSLNWYIVHPSACSICLRQHCGDPWLARLLVVHTNTSNKLTGISSSLPWPVPRNLMVSRDDFERVACPRISWATSPWYTLPQTMQTCPDGRGLKLNSRNMIRGARISNQQLDHQHDMDIYGVHHGTW